VHPDREEAISAAFASGRYTLNEIGDYFRLQLLAGKQDRPTTKASARGGKRKDLTVRSNSSKSSGLKSRPGSCPYAPR